MEHAAPTDRRYVLQSRFGCFSLTSGHLFPSSFVLAGMTVALHDVVLLSGLLHFCPDLSDPSHLSSLLERWHWSRKPLSSTINILSVALYDLFGADGVYALALDAAIHFQSWLMYSQCSTLRRQSGCASGRML